jgi:hypothetical protein
LDFLLAECADALALAMTAPNSDEDEDADTVEDLERLNEPAMLMCSTPTDEEAASSSEQRTSISRRLSEPLSFEAFDVDDDKEEDEADGGVCEDKDAAPKTHREAATTALALLVPFSPPLLSCKSQDGEAEGCDSDCDRDCWLSPAEECQPR